MNRQGKQNDFGIWEGGIEWTRIRHTDGTIRAGSTSNPIGGCEHGCRWDMPDGQTAICYAETTAEGPAARAYPHGFAHHYWRPTELGKWRGLKEPSGIFIDSMSDLWGAWVPAEQRALVLEDIRAAQAAGHIYMSLTKAAPQMTKIPLSEIPTNLWLGVSSPPDHFMGQALSGTQRERMLDRALSVLDTLGVNHTTWMSFEPLSQNYAQIVAQHPNALSWAVIGAASNGHTYYDPEEGHVRALLAVLDAYEVPVFFKGNLRRAAARWGLTWREEFPPVDPV